MEKSYYEIQLDALNSIDKLEDKQKYMNKIDFSKPIENDKDAQIIKDIEIYKEGIKESINKKISEQDIQDSFLIWVEKFNSYIVNIESVANYFSKKYNFVTINNGAKEKLFVFNGKFYEQIGKSLIKEKFEKLLGKYAKINPLNEVIAKVERKNYEDKKKFQTTSINLIPLNNGLFDLETKKLIPHTSKYYFKTIIPINYNPKKRCPSFLKFLNETLYENDIPVMQEWFGFNLYREYLIKKALICLGEKDTGKTVLLEVLTEFIGEKNKTGLSLQKIGSGSDFVKLSLRDKHANIYDDLSSRDLSDGGNFKIATGGGNISAEEKFGGYHQFRNYAKHTFATNKIPPVRDNDDEAYFSRWIVLRFDNPPEKQDLFLKKKLFKELEGILNWALEGLYRLLDNGKFSYNKTPEEIKFIMEMSGDPLIQFGEEVLLEKEKQKVSKEQMYQIYSIWAHQTDKPLLSKEQLGRRLNQKIKYLIDRKESKLRFWVNVQIKDEWLKKLEHMETTHKNGTLDAFKKNMRKCPEVIEDSDDIKISKASKPSQDLAQNFQEVGQIILELQETYGKLIPIEKLEYIFEAQKTKAQIQEAINYLNKQGIIFQPKKGYVQLL
jgi:putative DNA primase/helicase